MRRSRIAGFIAVAVLAALVPALAAEEEPEARLTLVGEVLVAEEDDDGNVTAVSILDPEHGEYLVAGVGKGKELRRLVGETVRATGKVVETDEDPRYFQVIHVEQYQVVEGYEDDPEESLDDEPGS